MSKKKGLTFRPQVRNANKHTPRGLQALETSVQRDGWIGAQTAAASGEIFDGSARQDLAADKFEDVEPIIVHSDGTRPVIVVRDDIESAEDEKAKRLAYAANRVAQIDLDWNAAIVAEDYAADPHLFDGLFTPVELGGITGQVDAKQNYGAPVDIPQQWMILVECGNEFEQSRLLEQFNGEGLRCRALIS